jgi:putative transcriptional regulator
MKRSSKKTARRSAAFRKLGAGLEDALAYHRGGRPRLTVRDVAVVRLASLDAKAIVTLRRGFGVSQAAFARLLNVSPRTIQAWETGARRPSDAALKLLHVIRQHPEVLGDGFTTGAA